MLTFLIILTLAFNAMAQTKEPLKTETPTANPADVSSIDAIMKAVYDVISGDAGKNAIGTDFAAFFTKLRG